MTITCEETKKRLKPFLDDLLAEDEYRAFISHVNTCVKCRDYVGAIGSLSNQLWELGKVVVPQDLSSMVIARFKDPVQIAQARAPARRKAAKRAVAAVLILAVVLIAIFFAVLYRKGLLSFSGQDDSPRVTIQKIFRRAGPNDQEAESLLRELKEIATNLGVKEKKE